MCGRRKCTWQLLWVTNTLWELGCCFQVNWGSDVAVRCVESSAAVSSSLGHAGFCSTSPLRFHCFFSSLRWVELGTWLDVCWKSCSDFLLPLLSEKLMFKNAPTPQEFKEGDDAVIVCDVVSSLPPTIIWKHKGRDVILKKDGKVQAE